MKGVNLGCGRVIMPCEKPKHHVLVPDEIYDPANEWDNVDWNPGEGVSHVVDLFDYPWRVKRSSVPIGTALSSTEITLNLNNGELSELLPDNTYDVALASHIVEHIPHHIVNNGQFVHRHPLWQDGWFAWFSELYRILKPGGIAYIAAPYAFSWSAISDPTHTRYLTPHTFGYLSDNAESPFQYRQQGKWDLNWTFVPFVPHDLGLQEFEAMQARTKQELPAGDMIWLMGQKMTNMVAEFMITMKALK